MSVPSKAAARHAAEAMKGDDSKAPPFVRDDGPNGKRRKRTKKRKVPPQRAALVKEYLSRR